MGFLEKFNKGMNNLRNDIMYHNPKGVRRLSQKDKTEFKKKKRKPKYYEVDHKKPVGLHKSGNPFDYTENLRMSFPNKNGRMPKYSYDWNNNLQAIHPKTHKRKTSKDNKDIRKKRKNINPYSMFDGF